MRSTLTLSPWLALVVLIDVTVANHVPPGGSIGCAVFVGIFR
jgi:hypothetical protein